MKPSKRIFLIVLGMCMSAAYSPVTHDMLSPGIPLLFAEQQTHRAPPAPEALTFEVIPDRGRRGQEVELLLSRPEPNAVVYFDGRAIPKKVHDGGKVLVVTVPGNAANNRYFEIGVNGYRVRAPRPFIIVGESEVHRAPPAPQTEVHRAPPAPPALSFHVVPDRGRRGQEVELILSRPVPHAAVFYDGRPLPKKTLAGGKSFVVTVPGDARNNGFFALRWSGQQIRAPRPFIIIGSAHRAPSAPDSETHRAPPAPPDFSFTFAPDRARRGQEVELILSRPLPNVTVFYNGRPLPKKVLQGGKILVVTVPGNAQSHRFFAIDSNGRRVRAPKPLIIIQ